MEYSERILDAVELMYRLHARQVRKGTGVPYLTHLLAVAALVGEHGGNEDQFIAALLHDAVEDAGGQETLTEIRHRYGDAVAEMVWDCSDTDAHPKPPWRARKEAFIAHVATLPGQTRLIIAADKLHNARTTTMDLRRLGDALWARFNGGRDGTLWYYAAVLDALASDWEHPILDDLRDAVAMLYLAASESLDQHSEG
jgi:(p)ppGpp synthase/HD superfamily hydrolase